MRLKEPTLIAIERKRLTESFKAFVEFAWNEVEPSDPFIDNWHIDAICDHLQAVAEGRINRLLINIPPGSGKSMIVSVLFPVWLWVRDPKKQIISTAFAEEQTLRDTQRSRWLIKSKWFQDRWPHVQIKDDADAKGNYYTEQRGFRVSSPFSSITGKRAHLVIIDDPHNTRKAESKADRSAQIRQFKDGASNRLKNINRDAIIVVMQRLHEEDISGWILEQPGKLGYCHLCIPMEFEGNGEPNAFGWSDPRTELDGAGRLMFPALFDERALATMKATMGLTYVGQYQQRPTSLDDGVFRKTWFHRFGGAKCPHPDCEGIVHTVPENLNYYMTSDHAPSGRHGNDYNVVRVWGVDAESNCWLVDSYRARSEMSDAFGVKDNATTGALPMIAKWRVMTWFPENDHAWKSMASTFNKAMLEKRVYCRIDPMPVSRAQGDKMARAQPFITLAQMGRIFYPEGSVGDLAIDELLRFPAAKHEDQVDADSMIGRVIFEMLPARQPVATNPIFRSDYRPRNFAGSGGDGFYM